MKKFFKNIILFIGSAALIKYLMNKLLPNSKIVQEIDDRIIEKKEKQKEVNLAKEKVDEKLKEGRKSQKKAIDIIKSKSKKAGFKRTNKITKKGKNNAK